MTEPLQLLERTLDQTASVVAGVRSEQAALPTPCESWDVGALVAHVILGLDKYVERARGGTPDWTAEVPDPGSDWAGAFRAKADELLDTWRAAGDLSGTLELPGMGELPATFPLDQQITEFAVHSWDLVRATGQPADLDPAIAEHALTWARQAMRPEYRGPATGFGEERPAPPDASAYERLAAFFGRQVS